MTSSNEPNIVDALRAETAKPYTVRGLYEIAKMSLPPMEYIWNGMPYSDAPTIVIYGAPGRGKSRFIQSLAKAQILGRDFGGLPTLQHPLTWLYVGSENGIHRTHKEARRFLFGPSLDGLDNPLLIGVEKFLSARGFTTNDADLLDRHFKTFTLESPEDCYISIGDEHNRERFVETFMAVRPDVVVWDPWGDVIVEGKELDDGKIRETVQRIGQCEALAKLEHKPANIFIAHARMGAIAEANASGMESGNYGKNSKALYSIARYALNIRAASNDENPPIEVICAKNNDGNKPPPLALKLNPDICEYELLQNFDHDAWQRQLEVANHGGGARTQSITPEQISNAYNCAVRILTDAAELPSNKDLTNALKANGVAKNVAEIFLSKAIMDGTLSKTAKMRNGKNGAPVREGNNIVYGMPEQIESYKEKWGAK